MTKVRKILIIYEDVYDNELTIFYSSFNQDSFVKQFFVIDCKLISFFRQLYIKALLNIDVIDYSFIDKDIARIACNEFKLKLILLLKSRFLKDFDDKFTTFIIYVIYSFFIVQNYCELLIFILITKLNNYYFILNKL